MKIRYTLAALPFVLSMPANAAIVAIFDCDAGGQQVTVNVFQDDGVASYDDNQFEPLWLTEVEPDLYVNDDEGIVFDDSSDPPSVWLGDVGFFCVLNSVVDVDTSKGE